MKIRLLSALVALSISSITLLSARAEEPAALHDPSREELSAFVRERLSEAVLLFDRHFRVPETGQYLDAIVIGEKKQPKLPSSIAATGVGLVSLAIGDALGVIDNAEEKAIKTLRNLLYPNKKSGFNVARSKNGWYPHFIDARTGKTSRGSQGKVSTIDTALLAAGSAIAARYFSAKSFTQGKGESRVFTLSGRLVGGVRWSKAIFNVERGLIHLIFKGKDEEPLERVFANPFDEYALLPCIAMRGEQLAGRRGPAHDLFFRHYADVRTLPMNDFKGESVIGKRNGNFIAHFTHLFAYYYCNNFGGQAAYRDELRQLASADRKHFKISGKEKFPAALWGLGAGSEIKFDENGKFKRSGYGVNNLGKNPHNTASPAIMAGFAPLFRAGSKDDPMMDLYRLWKAKTCRYDHLGVGFLWRCSARDPKLKVRKVEAVDFSTYLLGFAGREPLISVAFFRHFNL